MGRWCWPAAADTSVCASDGLTMKERNGECMQCFGYLHVSVSLYQWLWSTCSHLHGIFGGHCFQKDDISFSQAPKVHPVLPATSTTTVIAAKADSFLVTSQVLCCCEKVLTCHTSKRLKPLLGSRSRFLRRHRSLGIVESLDPASFLPPGQEIPTLDSSTQLIALPRQVKFPCPRDFCSCLSQSIAISQR